MTTRPPGGQPPSPDSLPPSYPPPAQPPGQQPTGPAAYPPAAYPPAAYPPGAYPPGAYPQPDPPQPWAAPLPDPPPATPFEGPLPEPPPGARPALHWGDPAPVPAPPPRTGPPPPYSRLAIAALVTGVLAGGAGLSLILGVAALLRIRRTHRRGAGLAVTGIVLAVVWGAVAAGAYYAVLSKPSVRDANGVVINKGKVPVNQLRVGDCIEKWETAARVGKVTVLPCTSAHDAEVFHTFDLPGDKFPGDANITADATPQCLDKSKTAVKAADLKTARVALLKPLKSSWGGGDHRVTCVVVQSSGTITRSVRA